MNLKSRLFFKETKLKKFSARLVCTLFLIFFSCPAFAGQKNSLTAIIGAIDIEIKLLQSKLTNSRQTNIEGINFIQGKLQNRNVVIAASGAGKVNAAATTALLIERYKPSEVIFTGIAGGIDPNLKPGDIVIAQKTAQHDYGLLTPKGLQNHGTGNPVTGQRNPIFYLADVNLLNLARQAALQVKLEKIKTADGLRLPKIKTGVVVTGDMFIASSAKCIELREKFGADAVEMEGAAVAQICWQQNVPCIVIRSMSDNANENAITDINQFYKTAADNSAALVEEILRILAAERIKNR